MRCQYKAWKQALTHCLQRSPRCTRKQTPTIRLVGPCVNTVFPRGVREAVDDVYAKSTEIIVYFPDLHEMPRQRPSKQQQPTFSRSQSVVSQCATLNHAEFVPTEDVISNWFKYFSDHASNTDRTGGGAIRGCVC